MADVKRTLNYEGAVYDLTDIYDENAYSIDEACELERLTGWTFWEWKIKGEQEGSALAFKAGAFIFVKRDRADLRFDAFRFGFRDVDVDVVTEEPEPAPDPMTADGEVGDPEPPPAT